MSRRDKLVAKIRARPPEAEFTDVQRLLEGFGWALRGETGSHAVSTKPAADRIVVPKVHGRKVKRVYLDLICERLGLDE